MDDMVRNTLYSSQPTLISMAKESKQIVLMVDDDPDDQEILIMALKEVDKDIVCTALSDSLEAMDKLKKDVSFVPDYIFLDLNMPKLNGLECLSQIKQLDHLRKSRVIMYSTSGETKIIQKCSEIGAAHYLVKPTGFSSLIEALVSIFKHN
ncbi:response regulator [Chitinophaga agrisoli]|uniref:Response regulator n=1 Tax=Chitinophaga agrisoli TaxID=2607653 RepID=A0A5B2VWR9_9BACT|nr:response regulator [Chitinophaga agrisoli]KAA2242697.1 response regulator [Chitinophaga agrisoli]